MNTETELKPCPFCGEKAIECQWVDHYGCGNTNCGAWGANLTSEQWNTRAKDPIIEALERRVEEVEQNNQALDSQLNAAMLAAGHSSFSSAPLSSTILELRDKLAALHESIGGMRSAKSWISEISQAGFCHPDDCICERCKLGAECFLIPNDIEAIQQNAIAATRAECEKLKAKWNDGAPSKMYAQEWFIAILDNGEKVVLTALPEEYSYQYKTADDTYYAKGRIKKWMQFPTSQFIPYNDAVFEEMQKELAELRKDRERLNKLWHGRNDKAFIKQIENRDDDESFRLAIDNAMRKDEV